MADFTLGKCDSCDAAVIWTVTTNGARMPVQGGNVQVEYRGETLPPLARVLTVAQQFGKNGLRQSHFASCPNAASHRRPRRSRA